MKCSNLLQSLLRNFLSLSLRTHLLLMAFLFTVPAFVLIIRSGMEQSKKSIEERVRDGKRLANRIVNEQYNLTGSAEQLVTVLAQLPEIKQRNKEAATTILADVLSKSPQYGNIIVADKNGDVWASGLPLTQPFNISDRRTFQNALKTGEFSSGEYVVGKISAKRTLGFGYPVITSNGDVAGVILVNFDFKNLKELLQRAGLLENSSYSIIDQNGVIVDCNPDVDTLIGTRIDDKNFQIIKNAPNKYNSIDKEANGDKFASSFRKMRLDHESSPYLYVKTTVSLKENQKKAWLALIYDVAILSSFQLAVILLVMLMGNFCFINRIRKLQEASQRLAEGNLQVKVSDYITGGELGKLGQAFDEMARKLASRELELVKSEDELLKLNQLLSIRVESEIEKRLEHERLMARHTRLAAIGEMIGAIAHQWRQPLATLGATIQSIRMAWERKCMDNDFLERAETDAQKQLYYMSDTIEDFRNFFSHEKVMEKFDIREKIDEIVLLVHAPYSNSGVSLQVVNHSPGCRLMLRGYKNEFKQAILNLLDNAFDAIMEKHLNDEQFDLTEGVVILSLYHKENTILIEVSDNGCGIPVEHADKIYDPYFTSKSGDKGTGIGLYMSKLIIEQSMEGVLSFISGPDGTVFRMELAINDSEEGDADAGQA